MEVQKKVDKFCFNDDLPCDKFSVTLGPYLILEDKSVYVGQWSDQARNGRATVYYEDGSFY